MDENSLDDFQPHPGYVRTRKKEVPLKPRNAKVLEIFGMILSLICFVEGTKALVEFLNGTFFTPVPARLCYFAFKSTSSFFEMLPMDFTCYTHFLIHFRAKQILQVSAMTSPCLDKQH
jgi:hypothetical protein